MIGRPRRWRCAAAPQPPRAPHRGGCSRYHRRHSRHCRRSVAAATAATAVPAAAAAAVPAAAQSHHQPPRHESRGQTRLLRYVAKRHHPYSLTGRPQPHPQAGWRRRGKAPPLRPPCHAPWRSRRRDRPRAMAEQPRRSCRWRRRRQQQRRHFYCEVDTGELCRVGRGLQQSQAGWRGGVASPAVQTKGEGSSGGGWVSHAASRSGHGGVGKVEQGRGVVDAARRTRLDGRGYPASDSGQGRLHVSVPSCQESRKKRRAGSSEEK